MQQTRHIGTRGSPLALYQANWVKDLLAVRDPDTDWRIKVLKTTGDSIKGELKDFGGKGLFTRELEAALLRLGHGGGGKGESRPLPLG